MDKPTRKGAILDKILTNMADFYPTPEICSHLGKSDHNIITAIPCLGTTWKHRPCSKTIKTTRHVTPETKRTFAADLTAINWSSLYRLPTCQEQFDAFMSVLNSLIEEHFPTTTTVRHSNDKPWVTKGFKALVQDRQKAVHEGDTETYRRLRNKINRKRSRLRASFYQSKVDKIGESNSRQWWKTIKTMIGLQPSKSHLCDLADQLCGGDTLALANDINMVFKEVTSDLQPLLPAAASVDHDVPDEFIISVTDCERKLSKLCVHKAMGPDNIPNWILKDFSYIIASPIAAIYNSSVRQSYVPPSWKQAEILPIPKVPQVTSLAKHLHPIALTPVLSKVLESFVVSWMREATVHSETQYGGIKDSSSTLALITMLHHVLQRLERKNTYARILLIDFSKAFDHIDHNILLDKLKTNGVPQICVDWQKAFLTMRTQRVKLADTTSDWTEMAGGVPQGTLSGPENCLNMIDDLHTDVDDVKFVDDVTLYEVCNTHSQNKLQNAVNDIQTWATDNNMSLNASKTKELLVYYGREELDIPRITINGDVLERVSCAKLLVCHIMSNLSWEDHIANLVSKASRRLHLLRELKRAGLSTKDLLTCYVSIVRSTTEYACQVWSTSLTNEQSHAVETIQRRAMQIISPTRRTRGPYTNTG